MRWVRGTGAAAGFMSILVPAIAVAAPLASAGFETSEGYNGNDLMFEAHSDVGWASEWFHVSGGGPGNLTDQNPWSVAVDDGTAAQGDQHYRQHRFEDPINWPNAAAARTASTIAMHRLFAAQTGHLYLRFEMRIDTVRSAPQWFKNFAGFYVMGDLIYGNTGNGEEPPADVKIGPLVRFDRNGSLGVNQLGTFIVIPHKWDGTGALPTAVNSWVTIEVDIDIPGQVYELSFEGSSLGTYQFASEDVDSLNGLRLQGPSAHDGDASQPPNPINWQNGASFDDIFLGTSAATGTDCDTSVLPTTQRAAGAVAGEPATPSNITYTIYNDSTLSHDYAIAEVLSDGTANDYDWLSLNKSNATIGAGAVDSFTAAIDPLAPDPDLPGGVHTAYVKITDLTANCGDPGAETEFIRQIVLTIRDWEVAPSILQTEHFHPELPSDVPQPIVYTVRNVGATSINYAAAESSITGVAMDYNWLSLNKTNGTVPTGGSDAVTVTIDHNVVGFGRSTGYIKFTQGAFTEIRKISFFKSAPGYIQLIEYLGDVDPTSPDSGGPGISFDAGSTTAQGQVESAATSAAAQGADDGKVFRIVDTDALSTKFGAVREDTSPIDIDRLAGATVLARLKVLTPASDPATTGTLFIFDEHLAAAGLYGGTDNYVREVKRGIQAALPIGDGEWHILRMTGFGSVDETRYFRVYLDENPTPVLEITPASGGNLLLNDLGEGLGKPTLGFGAGSLPGTIDVAFDWITGTNVEAFAPGAEVAVLGRSLIPVTCGDPYADLDDDDDVDMVDFSYLQNCHSSIWNPATPAGFICGCLDRNNDQVIDEFDVNSFVGCSSGPAVPADIACDD